MQGDETYLLQRGIGAKHHKFSFHKSRNCRWAQIEPGRSGSERCIFEWTRSPIATAGSSQAVPLLSMTFPTNHLSAGRRESHRKMHWLEPAPCGWAVYVEILLTNESPAVVDDFFRANHSHSDRDQHRHLFGALKLRSGAHVCVASSVFDCGPVDLRVPGEPRIPGQLFGDVHFPDQDDQKTGRPIRMLLMTDKAVPPVIWELGGYEAAQGGAAWDASPGRELLPHQAAELLLADGAHESL